MRDPEYQIQLINLAGKALQQLQNNAAPSAAGRNQAAFDYACKYMDCKIQKGAPLPALVLDARKKQGGGTAVQTDDIGVQTPLLLISSNDGGFEVLAKAAGRKGPVLKPGDLVIWIPMMYMEETVLTVTDKRFGWAGTVPGTLKPVLDLEEGWHGGEKFWD